MECHSTPNLKKYAGCCQVLWYPPLITNHWNSDLLHSGLFILVNIRDKIIYSNIKFSKRKGKDKNQCIYIYWKYQNSVSKFLFLHILPLLQKIFWKCVFPPHKQEVSIRYNHIIKKCWCNQRQELTFKFAFAPFSLRDS